MALKYSAGICDAQLNVIESTTNASGSATLEIRTLAPPANCAAADVGSPLATITLGADWLATSTGGGPVTKTAGPWTDTADANGTAGHFRIKGGTTCHLQGTVGLAASTPDMVVDNTAFQSGQTFTVSTFSITHPNL